MKSSGPRPSKIFFPLLAVFSLLIFSSPASAWPVPDTGQTTSYSDTFGEDHDYTINPPSYTKLGENGVELPDSATQEANYWLMTRDNVTGLVWEMKTDDGGIHDKDNTYTWCDTNPDTNGGNQGTCGNGTDTEDFIMALNAANYGGYSDWRLPSQKELLSIVDYGRYNPAVDTTWFSNMLPYWWSSTTHANNAYYVWLVYFSTGDFTNIHKSNSKYVHAVRGGPDRSLVNHLVINGDGTVTDTATGLMWQQQDDGTEKTWTNALSYAEGLTLAQYDDWRLPTIEELASIVDLRRYNPAIDKTYFPEAVSSYYWSSTTFAYEYKKGCAWRVYFYDGDVSDSDKSLNYYVRAVREGQNRSLGHLIISAPQQAAKLALDGIQAILWDTQALGGNVSITLSRDGGKIFSETIADTTPNDGAFDWTVTGAASFNCVLKITPLVDPTKFTTQGLFTIFQLPPLSGTVTDLTTGNPLAGVTVAADNGETATTDWSGYFAFLGPGTYTVTITKTGYRTLTLNNLILQEGQPQEKLIELTALGPLNIITAALPAAETGVGYDSRVRISGETYDYAYTIVYGSLPPGLLLTPGTGVISGVATAVGSYTFGVAVSDSQGGYAETEYTIEVTKPLLATTDSPLPRATRNQYYSQTITASGGTEPYTFAKIAGMLPTGLSLASTGLISGTPTVIGDSSFTVRVTDASGRNMDKVFALSVDLPLAVSTAQLATGISGQVYSTALAADGGYGSYTWSVFYGQLPQGITLDSAGGALSGTSNTALITPLVFRVHDQAGRTAFKSLNLIVTPPLAFAALPTGALNVSYSEQIRVTGGLAPYTFSYTGLLPTGLTLASGTGVVSGTPTAVELKNVQVTVRDSSYPTPQESALTMGIRIVSTLAITNPAVLRGWNKIIPSK